jgi:septal ring factor EnvC (AmiA/AmiB activator)
MKFLCSGWLVLFVGILPLLVHGQDEDSDSLDPSKQLRELREQIQQLESQIASSDAREQDLVTELDGLDRSINLRQSVIKTLSKERVRLDKSILRTGDQIQERQRDINRLTSEHRDMQERYGALQDVVHRRAVQVYKHWNVDRWTILLKAQSITDLLSRQYYFRKIHHWDIRHLEELSQRADSLKSLENRIQKQRDELRVDLGNQEDARDQKNRLIEQKREEETTLIAKKSTRSVVLADIRSDRDAMENQLAEKQLAVQEIERQIAAMEARRTYEAPPPGYFASGQPFTSLKGKLPMPVQGEIVTHFGANRHPQLGTITENTGIDIQAPMGALVRTVSDAQVGMVTWLRGFGNTIILDHQDGHYSVYAHLDEVHVAQGNWLRAGEVIGTVGDTGSLDGPRLHFEIWQKRITQDPESWLMRTPYP